MGSKLIIRTAWIMMLVAIVSKRGKATLDMKPSDTSVLLNGSAFFSCSTFNGSNSSSGIFWYHYPVGSQRKDVYEFGEIRPYYKKRFRVNEDLSKGRIDLIIEATTLEDAGIYECLDGEGQGEAANAQLNVLETEPICNSNIPRDGVIGSNDCGIRPDEVEMTCRVTYRGNNPIQLEWRNGLEKIDSSVTVDCNNTTDRSTCNFTATGDRIRNNSAFICRTKNSGTNTFSCSTDFIKILYVMSDNATLSATVSGEEEFECSANSSQQCTYTWYKDDKLLVTPKSLKPTTSGQYICKANCSLRNEICLVTARTLNVTVETTSGNAAAKAGESGTTPIGLIVGVVVAIIIAIIVAAIVIWCLHKRKREEKEKLKNVGEENVPIEDLSTEEENSVGPVVSKNEADPTDQDEAVIRNACNLNAFIGRGSNGDVYGPGQYGNKECTCKKIMLTAKQVSRVNEEGMTKADQICIRGPEWKELDQDNLIKFYDFIFQRQPPIVYIIMEYASGGTVRTALDDCKKDLPVGVVNDWATQIAKGLSYLHEREIVHKGIKCAKILIMEPFDPSTCTSAHLKLSSYSLTNEMIDKTNPASFKGMYAWMAPETILKSVYSNESDIWSYGVTVWEILTREIPYKKNEDGELLERIPKGELPLKIPESCPSVLRDIFRDCFQMNPEERPPLNEILFLLNGLDV